MWLLACNNDHTVKMFALPDMRAVGSLTCPAAVNYAALSPDGQELLAVGDSCDVHLFHATPTGVPLPLPFASLCSWHAIAPAASPRGIPLSLQPACR